MVDMIAFIQQAIFTPNKGFRVLALQSSLFDSNPDFSKLKEDSDVFLPTANHHWKGNNATSGVGLIADEHSLEDLRVQ